MAIFHREMRSLIFVMVSTLMSSLSFAEEAPWMSLFNGKDLEGWTPKITNHALGKNAHNTFRVEDGILKVSYADYDAFDGQFGHLYTNLSYSHYLLRLECRFEGKMMKGAPRFADLNSGVMIHSQPPQSMTLDQRFPLSVELQILADQGKGPRPTANVCTPGTHIMRNGKLIKTHKTKSNSPTFPADEWVQIEIEVRGHQEIIHRINGQEVIRYQKPQIDPDCRVTPGKPLLEAGASQDLSFGHIALQAEGQGIWFRNIAIKPLPIKK